MNRKELYLKTVDLLLDAYNEGKLSHGSCTACAVGNICGGDDRWANLFVTNRTEQKRVGENDMRIYTTETGVITIKHDEVDKYIKLPGFSYYSYGIIWRVVSPEIYIKNKNAGLELIKSTGYTTDELAKAEYAFESSIANTPEGYDHFKNEDKKKGQFIGLTAVLDVLAEIHELGVEETALKVEKQTRLEGIYENLCA